VYVTNFGDDNVSSDTVSADGRYLYALDADAGRIHDWTLDADGVLTPAGLLADSLSPPRARLLCSEFRRHAPREPVPQRAILCRWE
jgi:hypothetical protein